MVTGIAIVTVCLNDLQGLKATFESLLAQTCEPAQWIVVDGNSTDGTRQWLESRPWPRLDWSSARDRGIFDGMNKGLRRVTSEYVVFLNSGDTLAHPGVLAAIAQALSRSSPKPSLLFGDSFEEDTSGRRHLRRARNAGWIWVGMPTTHQAMYFRVGALREFDARYALSGDYAAVAQMYREFGGASFLYLPEPLCVFRLGGRSSTQWRLLHSEHREIRLAVLGMGRPTAWIVHWLHHVHELVKRYAPSVHRLFRYG